jgi:hypothetical protein
LRPKLDGGSDCVSIGIGISARQALPQKATFVRNKTIIPGFLKPGTRFVYNSFTSANNFAAFGGSSFSNL